MDRNKILILTDHGDPQFFPARRMRVDPGLRFLNHRLFGKPGFRLVRGILRGFIFFLKIHRVRSEAIVVTYGAGMGFVFAFCQWLFRFLIAPKFHFMFDLLLDAKRPGVGGFFDSFKMRVFKSVVGGAVVWGKSDITTFAREFGIPAARLHFHPYHHTLEGFSFTPGDDGYIFCGGNNGRDFSTVIEAIGPLGYPLKIATQVTGVKELARKYPHIQVGGVTPEEFRRLLARSRVVVEAHPRSFFRTAGHQTILNAQYLGKCIILADRTSADGYLRSGVHGMVIEAGDIGELSRVTRRVWENSRLRDRLGRRARKKGEQRIYRTLGHMQSLYNLALKEYLVPRGRSLREARIQMY